MPDLLLSPTATRAGPIGIAPELAGSRGSAGPVDALRELIRERRAAQSAADRERAARGLRDVFLGLPWARTVRCVAIYETTDDGAPGTGPLREALAGRGVVVLMLRAEGHGGLRWTIDLTDLRSAPARPAGLSPVPLDGRATLAGADVVIAPALAVDTLGHRLGGADDDYEGLLYELPDATPALVAVHDDEIFDAALGALSGGTGSPSLLGALTPTRLLPLGSGLPHTYLAGAF